ncbi:MAG: TrmB family transcriptional regulator [Halanaeroarchaeum sp.]
MHDDADFDPIDALERLGLRSYEAQVFVALQELGSGSAKDVSDVADVPQSQVYGAAESLEGRGLIEIQQSTPKTYRPVALEEARDRLRERFERTQDRAFEYLRSVQNRRSGSDETADGVWRISGAAAVESRTESLLETATDRIVYGTNAPIQISEPIESHLHDRAASGVDVLVLSDDSTVGRRMSEVTVVPPPIRDGAQTGRLLVVDDDTILMSVVDEGDEIAVWSARTGFATVLVGLVEDAIAPALSQRDSGGDPGPGSM